MNHPHRLPAVLFAAFLAFSLASAAEPPTTALDDDSDEPVKLEQLDVTEVPIEENIIPSSRPFNSVYGTDLSILETPRNVTIISREQLNAISIQDVRDFSKLTSSSYTRTNFGAPTTPDIRTQIADLYQNGMRIGLTSNGNGLPINFNAVESVNIVKGPATAVYGASQYIGGYADLITKRPFFGGNEGSASVTVGSYNVYRWTIDWNQVSSPALATRVSYSGEASKGYFSDGKKKTQALYAAVTHNIREGRRAFYNAEIFYANYTENFGVNRPTQLLIDEGLYQTGVNNNPAPDFAAYPFGYADAQGNPITFDNLNIVGGTPAPQSDPQNSRWVVSGFPAGNRIELGPLVKLNRRLRLLRPGDDSNGLAINAQSIQTLELSPDVTLENNTFFRYVKRDTISRYMYSEIIDPSYSLESRTELRLRKGPTSTNAGLSLRYQRVKAYNDFFSEPAAVWDITRDRSFIDYTNSVNFPNPFTQVPVPGWPDRYYTPDNGDSGHSRAFYASPFFQTTWRANDRLILVGGGRLDVLALKYTDPAGFLPGDSTTVGLPNGNVSAVFALTDALSTYATVNYSQNPVGSTGNGGGITTAGNDRFLGANLRNEATLYEIGAKQNFAEGKGFVSVAVFRQVRDDLQQDRSVVQFDTRGFEFEINYQPTRFFYVTAGYSYTDSTVNTPQFDVGNTDLPTTRFFTQPFGVDLERQGVPENLFNVLATYRWQNGFGLSAGAVFTSEINNNVAGTLVIPSQYSLDITASYLQEKYEVRLAVLNATDEDNWSAPNAVYGNESILAEPGARAELTVKLKF